MSGSFHHFYKIIYESIIICTSKNVLVKSNLLKYSVSLKYSRTFDFVRFYEILPFRISFEFSICVNPVFTTYLIVIDHLNHASLGFLYCRIFNFELFTNVEGIHVPYMFFVRNAYIQTFENQWCIRFKY